MDLLSNHGERPRRYRNALGLAVPDRGQLEPLRRAFLYLKAIERVEGKRARLNLTREQLSQLRERKGTEGTAVESAMRALYPAVWLPRSEAGGLALEKVEAGGRPLQATGVHERLMELLTLVPPPRLFNTVTPSRIVDLMRLGESLEEGKPPRMGISTCQVRDAFFETLGFPRLTDEGAIQRAIAQGVHEGVLGFVGLANDQGGTLLIGVEDDGTVTGLHPRHRTHPTTLVAFVANRTVRPVSVEAEFVDLPEGPVVVLVVSASRQPVSTSDGRLLVRYRDSRGRPGCRPLYAYELTGWLADRGQADPTALVVSDATWDDLGPLEFARLRRMVEENPGDTALLRLSDQEIAGALGLARPEGDRLRPTLAGLLLVGKESTLDAQPPGLRRRGGCLRQR